MKKTYTFQAFILSLLFCFSAINLNAQCYAGELQTTGTVMVPLGETYDVMIINDTIPTGGGFGWYFDNTHTDGTGALGEEFIFQAQTGDETFDNDLNGVLTGNNFTVCENTWVVKGAVYSDATQPFASICHFTTDSLIVVFEPIICDAGAMTTIGEEAVCNGEDFTLTTMNDTITTGGGFGWFFYNDVTGGTGALGNNFLLSGTSNNETFDIDLNGILSGNGFPAFEGTWVVKAATYSNAFNSTTAVNSVCSVSEDSLIVTFNPALELILDNPFNTYVTATASGGTAGYTYEWSNGETGDTASNLVDGTLTVTATDTLGCTITDLIILSNTSVEEIEGLLSYELSPNPTMGIAQFRLSFAQAKDFQIQVLGLDGKLIQNITNQSSKGGTFDLDLSNAQSGIYVVKVLTDNQQYSQRLLKL